MGGVNPVRGGEAAVKAAGRSLAREAKLIKPSFITKFIKVSAGKEPKLLEILRIIATKGRKLPEVFLRVPGK